jgi:nucleoside-diphosphate-sugar epimerase
MAAMGSLTTKKVLLTGASGFIGRHCIRPLLEAGYEVHASSSTASPRQHDGVQWHRADLLERAQTGPLVARVRPTHLLHLAWYVVPGRLLASTENVRWVQASLELLRQFGDSGGVRAVMTGSCYEYSWNWDDGRCSETDTPLEPATLYGASKKALSEILAAYSDVVGLSSAWARLFFLYGPAEHPDRLVASVIRSLLQGVPAPCSHGNQLRDYLYIEDVADAIVALLDSATPGPINVGAGKATALKDIVMTIGAMLRKEHLIQLGAIPARENDVHRVVADTQRARAELDWQPRYDLATGLRRTVGWWQEQMQITPTGQS